MTEIQLFESAFKRYRIDFLFPFEGHLNICIAAYVDMRNCAVISKNGLFSQPIFLSVHKISTRFNWFSSLHEGDE